MAAIATTAEHRKYKIPRQMQHWRVRSVRWFSLVFYCSAILTTGAALAAAHASNGSNAKTSSRGGAMVPNSDGKQAHVSQYSQPLAVSDSDSNGPDVFRPIIPTDLTPEDISQNVFNPEGQYRVFESAESDLRATSMIKHKGIVKAPIELIPNSIRAVPKPKPISIWPITRVRGISDAHQGQYNEIHNMNPERQLEELLSEYLQRFFGEGVYEPGPNLVVSLQKNYTGDGVGGAANATDSSHRHARDAPTANAPGHLSVNIPRAVQTGRVFFFAGLKKVLWPIFMGLQILKSLLFALLLPSLIGSVGKLLGKGIISGSAPLFVRPLDMPQDVDFKDNTFNFDVNDDSKFPPIDIEATKDDGYAYNQAEASQTHSQYAYNAAALNQQTFSRYGMNEQQKMQDSYLSALQSLSAASFKNSNSISGSSSAGGLAGLGGGGGGGGTALKTGTFNASDRNKPASPANMDTFQTFQKVPASSLLLSNYDPFYSPLLSRLDSVFAQLKLNSENEACREKLICLMYSNPAKYAPYSNLVSAQLSRELNELRKPTSDNPDILRFFKYMRAAKDGQDGVDCEKTFNSCKDFKDFENPAMLSTYNDINKLVQARQLGRR